MTRGTDIMTHSPLILRPDPKRTVLRPFDVGDPAGFDDRPRNRVQRVAERVIGLDDDAFARELDRVRDALFERHHDIDAVMARRFTEVKDALGDVAVPPDRAALVGAYFLQEYAFESAALFNPSMVAHDDQSGLPAGAVRFVLSLRGIGEGHLSSVTFRVGTWSPGGGFAVDDPSPLAVAPRIERADRGHDTVRIICDDSQNVSETIIFPVTPAQACGIEDMRLVRFTGDDGIERKLGTYTAFDGSAARCEMMEGFDYNLVELRTMTGPAAQTKGLALFPRKVGGRFMMLGRQDSENIWLLSSDSLTHWEGGEPIIRPRYAWEFVQMGNCGSPIEIDEGWLVLTHGVGSVRNYCIGAVLLDRDDPRKVIARRPLPLVHPSPEERGGYVPNVVYSCGGMVHDRTLLLPYGVADDFTTFAHVSLDALLATME